MAQNQTLGRGRLMFAKFPGSTYLLNPGALMYLGNTPAFNLTTALTNLDHYDADAGFRVKDISAVIQDDQTAAFTTDNISADNLALWYLGQKQSAVQAAAVALTETVTVGELGSYIQLGITPATPSGVRNIANVIVKDGAAVVANDGTNYTVDLPRGMAAVLPNAATILPDDELIFTYDTTASTRSLVISQGVTIYGRLQFMSLNEIGPTRDHVYPYVKLTPTGSYELKGDAWQVLQFQAEILTPPDGTPRSIIG